MSAFAMRPTLAAADAASCPRGRLDVSFKMGAWPAVWQRVGMLQATCIAEQIFQRTAERKRRKSRAKKELALSLFEAFALTLFS